MKLINLYNQKAAGPKNISLNLVKQAMKVAKGNEKFLIILPDIEDYKHIYASQNCLVLRQPSYKNIIMKVVFRLYLDLILLPSLIRRYKIDSLLAFGNFLLSRTKVKKVVLLHHPYLVDDKLLSDLPIFSRVNEYIKRLAFFITVRNADTLIVQSEYMKSSFQKKYATSKVDIYVIHNPISKTLSKELRHLDYGGLIEKRLKEIKKKHKILYVSRFYPHKNHNFLISLSKKLNQRSIKHEILVTIDTSIRGAEDFINEINDSKVSIINIGEQPQEELSDVYQSVNSFIFPSKAETFGNPLIEAMGFALPIVVPELDYAFPILEEAGVYFNSGDIDECVDRLEMLKEEKVYLNKAAQSLERFKSFPEVECWFKQYLRIM